MPTSCNTCTQRKDCWILNIIEYRAPLGDPGSFTYDMAVRACRGECLRYIDKDESTEGC